MRNMVLDPLTTNIRTKLLMKNIQKLPKLFGYRKKIKAA